MAEESGNPAWQPETSPNGGLSVTAQLQNLRNLLNSDRQSAESQRSLETFDREVLLRTTINERRRQEFDTQSQNRDAPAVSDGLLTNTSPSSLVRSRRRAFRPSERLQRHRDRYTQAMRSNPPDLMGNLPGATPPPMFADNAMDDYTSGSRIHNEQRFRSKRRKLDDGTFDDETRIISYGDEGRVTPGPLKMDIIRCDGGEYSESASGSAQLVLQDDPSVYSTKENKCNMLLKHIGGMPFSLTQVIIKAPGDGFDSPIQEGMVFVAMSDDKLLESTSYYDKYSPRSYRFHQPFRRHDYYRPSQEYLNSSRSPLRSIDRPRYPRDPQRPLSRHVENDLEMETSSIPGFDVTFVDPTELEGSPSFTPRSPASWRDLDAEYSLRSYADRYRSNPANNDARDNASVTSSESEDEYAPPYRDRGTNASELDDDFAYHRRYLNHMRMAHERGDADFLSVHPSRRARHDRRVTDASMQRLISSRMGARSSDHILEGSGTVSNGTSSKTVAEQSARTPQPTGEVLAPHAKFSMAENQTSIAINFDPPVAGRYILIKLWASCPASNIDIQCIIPHGYGGPRFFPSIKIR